MELVLQQKQTQNLTMTVELRQAIELLQYSTHELYEYLKEQEMENPLIQLEEHPKDHSYEERTRNPRSTSTSQSPMDLIKSDDIGMRAKLVEQAKLLFTDSQDQKIARFILYNIDDNGYFNLTENDFASFDEAEITRGIHLLQQLGPIGIGARNLKECLLLQITYEFPQQKLAESLIKNHLDLLANRKWNEIASGMNISLEKVKEITDFIKTLHPKPCVSLSDFSAQYLNPDIIIESKETGISFYLNDSYLPTIHFTNNYTNTLTSNDETSKYIRDKTASYNWLISSIEQRRQTIIKIMKVIIKKQEAFFTDGFIALKPLTLKEVADEIDMHESTVSRATTNKVLQTPKGSFDLRMLFTSKLEMTDGNDISQSKMKALLKGLIENENKQKPLSDQKIADYFKAEKGITISRRTISKYREELNIPSSRMRKEI
ncbi:RNA polymerase factor sigma-54 [Sporosarcina sp. Marseille-Q4063]|uniref:RNA polymerase factor sigma-54 n=1 Tax=Sporosarcina sp. Marseille-Q4063 TaxID=2810514 RepID=UPI001BAF46F9|nr:RNA polymerase factor sigma-54 [Sporosarcina sp. Marseille-Q4063]QUW21384.1 RNA polymerase factor sigma-54 [Sporosarcina sp. Marseille-Q4063]